MKTTRVFLSQFFGFILFFSHSYYLTAAPESPLAGGQLRLTQSARTVDAPMLNTAVEMNINGLTARVKVTQVFENNSAEWVEGKYFFPLPEKSAVDHLKMKIGERIIEGEIQEKQAAKKIYEAAKISGKKASLVEQHRPNVFSNSVANIGPHESIEITIEYQQDLSYNKDTGLSITFPMTMTERYTPKVILQENYDDLSNGFQTQPSELENILIPQVSAELSGNDVTLQVNLNSGFALASVTSDSHPIAVKQASTTDYQVSFSVDKVKADRDFILNWQPAKAAEPRVALFSEQRHGENYISLMLMPPSETTNDTQLPREVIFVLDTSGSMSGESIKQAKQALLSGLDTLVAGDRFNIIEFNSDASQLFYDAQNYNQATRRDAIDFVNRLRADGGTEMLKALDMALTNTRNQSHLRQVIFLTDGAISNEAQLFNKIENDLGDSRLFTVGIGSAPNEFFMKRAAKFGRGTHTFIADINQTESRISQLFKQISSPILSHITVQWPSGSSVEMWPQKIPDLFAGEPLWIKAKLNKPLHGDVEISGRLPQALWQTKLPLNASKNQVGISQLWAREKIAAIMNDAHHGQLNEAQKQLVIQTALQHHLVSRYTSLVAVDKTPSRIEQTLHEKMLAQVTPKGSTQNKVASHVNYPRTALSLRMNSTWSWLSLIAALVVWLVSRMTRRGTAHE